MSDLEISDLSDPGKGLKKVLVDLADGIKADLEALPDDSAKRIHDIRVRSKKLWSLSKLARRHSDKTFTRELKTHLREIKNSFSDSRDEEVMRSCLQRLLPEDHARKACEATGLLNSAGDDNTKVSGKTLDCAEKLIDLVKSLDWKSLGKEDLCHRFARHYRVAQEAMAAAREKSDDELMHDWRKCVKDVFYQATALRGLPPAEAMVQPLDDLADVLGSHHDMAVLLVRLRRHETDEDTKAAILKEKDDLERIAVEKGKELLGGDAPELEKALEA